MDKNKVSKEKNQQYISVLPKFSEIDFSEVEKVIDDLLSDCREEIKKLEDENTEGTWNSLAKPLQNIEERIEKAWAPISHLNAVNDNPELRTAVDACLPKISAFYNDLSQNQFLYKGYKVIRDSDDFDGLTPPQKKVIQNAIKDFRLAGAELEESDRSRMRDIVKQLAQLSNSFEKNVLDVTDEWYMDITDAEKLAGLPPTLVELARQTASNAGEVGWRFTLQMPSYLPFMTFSELRNLREIMYRAYVTRASDMGRDSQLYDNGPLMVEILRLRAEMASLLGFNSYAEYALENRMASSSKEVKEFLIELVDLSKESAKDELSELRKFANLKFNHNDIQAWDTMFYSEKLKQSLFNFSDEDVRPYFPFPRVLQGLFKIVKKLFGLSFREVEYDYKWHPDVCFFEMFDESNVLRGSFFLDLFSRPRKRGGAWMSECVNRKVTNNNKVQIPVAFITCNFPPQIEGRPSLLNHDEVITLFHEFGHGLHHMLTLVDEPSVAGINGVPWDAVELPSQFLENWCWEAESLSEVSGHHESGESIPSDLLEQIKGARNFNGGMQMLRQLEFSMFDMALHSDAVINNESDIQQILDETRHMVSINKPPIWNRFQNAFSHIFAGGYAAGYYSYKWAEVLSSDAFSRFEEEGLFENSVGRQFCELILETGGVGEPLEKFQLFRGRAPSVKALLRHSGLVE